MTTIEKLTEMMNAGLEVTLYLNLTSYVNSTKVDCIIKGKTDNTKLEVHLDGNDIEDVISEAHQRFYTTAQLGNKHLIAASIEGNMSADDEVPF